MLCSVCQSLPPLAEFGGQVESHHTLHSLQTSAAGGCEFCVLIWESLKPQWSTQRITAGEATDKPEEAQVTLHYGSPLSLKLAALRQEHKDVFQYIWVSPSINEQGGAKIELCRDVHRG
jgi:hypothetical protein